MTDQLPSSPQSRPPNREQLAERLGDRMAAWNALRETVIEIGATWKWAYSDATGAWSYRSYLAGDRFFVALSLTPSGFELSLNVKPQEWNALSSLTSEEAALLEPLKAKALASGEDPAWLHVPVSDETALSLLTKLLVIRAQRPQKPRLKPSRKR